MWRRVHPLVKALIGSLAAAAALYCAAPGADESDRSSIAGERKPPRAATVVHCAASLRAPLEELAKQFETKHGGKVELLFGASQTLLTSVQLTQRGDLLLPADMSYVERAKELRLVDRTWEIAGMHAVLLVRPSNPKGIRSLDDLLRDDVTLAQAASEAAAIGMLTQRHLEKSGSWTALATRTRAMCANVSDAANAVAVGAVDAAIVWNVVASLYPKLETLDLPELRSIEARVGMASLKTMSPDSDGLQFARFVADPAAGGVAFAKHGFAPISAP